MKASVDGMKTFSVSNFGPNMSGSGTQRLKSTTLFKPCPIFGFVMKKVKFEFAVDELDLCQNFIHCKPVRKACFRRLKSGVQTVC